MKIVIVEGKHDADYLIKMYKKSKNELIIINSKIDTCTYLSEKNGINVLYGRPTKEFDLNLAAIHGADLFIALSEDDAENYVACKMAKYLFNVKRCIATVINPKNVDIFKKLNIDSALNSSYLLAEEIKIETSVEELIKTLSLVDNKILIIELIIQSHYPICGKALKEIDFAKKGSVTCIYRNAQVLIPNGNSLILEGDKVFVVTTKEFKNDIGRLFMGKEHEID